MKESEFTVINEDYIQNPLAAKLQALSEQNPDSDVGRLINETREARILDTGKRLELLGKAWVNRNIRGLSWGKSREEIKREWGEIESDLKFEGSNTRFDLLEKLVSGLGLLVRRVDKDQIRYAYSILSPVNEESARVLIRSIPGNISISSSSIIFLKCLVDLWDDPKRLEQLKNYMIDPAQRVRLTNSKNGDIQIGGTVDVVNSFYDFEKSLPE